MKAAAGVLALVAVLAIFLGTGSVYCHFQDDASATGNSFTAFSSAVWTQTTRDDFATGSGSKVDIETVPGDIILEQNGKKYSASGSFRSRVFDTGTPNATIDLLFWNATVPVSTSARFFIRASDSPFSVGSNTPAWINVGTDSPAFSGLPHGRYIQWRVDLATSSTKETPALKEMQVWYH